MSHIMTETAGSKLQWYAVRYKPTTQTLLPADIPLKKGDRKQKARLRRKQAGRPAFLIETLLRQQGFQVFLPTKRVWRQKSKYSKQKTLVTYPLLVGWVFVGWPENQSKWRELFNIHLVRDVAGVGKQPLQIAPDVMSDIMMRWGKEKMHQAPTQERYMRTHHEFNIGDTVQIVAGPFEGQIIKVMDLKGAQAEILMPFLGGERQMAIKTQYLEVA